MNDFETHLRATLAVAPDDAATTQTSWMENQARLRRKKRPRLAIVLAAATVVAVALGTTAVINGSDQSGPVAPPPVTISESPSPSNPILTKSADPTVTTTTVTPAPTAAEVPTAATTADPVIPLTPPILPVSVGEAHVLSTEIVTDEDGSAGGCDVLDAGSRVTLTSGDATVEMALMGDLSDFTSLCLRSGTDFLGTGTLTTEPLVAMSYATFGDNTGWLIGGVADGVQSLQILGKDGIIATVGVGGDQFFMLGQMRSFALRLSLTTGPLRLIALDEMGAVVQSYSFRQADAVPDGEVESPDTATDIPGPFPTGYNFPDLSCYPDTSAGPMIEVPDPYRAGEKTKAWMFLDCSAPLGSAGLLTYLGAPPTRSDQPLGVTVPWAESELPYLGLNGLGASDGGQQLTLIMSAFDPGVSTAEITFYNGSSMIFGTDEHPWLELRDGWHGFMVSVAVENPALWVTTFDATGQQLGSAPAP